MGSTIVSSAVLAGVVATCVISRGRSGSQVSVKKTLYPIQVRDPLFAQRASGSYGLQMCCVGTGRSPWLRQRSDARGAGILLLPDLLERLNGWHVEQPLI